MLKLLLGNCCPSLCEQQSLAEFVFAPSSRYNEVLVAADELWIMDRLLTGSFVIDCFCFISLLDGRKTIFFLYDFFFFFGNKIPQTNKIRSKKRQRIQFHFPKKHLRSHTTASSFSTNSGDQRWLVPSVLPATLIRLLQQPSHQLLQVLPGFKLFFQALFHPFVFLQGEKQRNKDAVNARALYAVRYFHSSAAWCLRRGEITGTFDRSSWGYRLQVDQTTSNPNRPLLPRRPAQKFPDFGQAETSCWKPNFSLGWRTLFSCDGFSHLQTWDWREEDIFPLSLQELVSTRPL